jgi:hypothetical protein
MPPAGRLRDPQQPGGFIRGEAASLGFRQLFAGLQPSGKRQREFVLARSPGSDRNAKSHTRQPREGRRTLIAVFADYEAEFIHHRLLFHGQFRFAALSVKCSWHN